MAGIKKEIAAVFLRVGCAEFQGRRRKKVTWAGVVSVLTPGVRLAERERAGVASRAAAGPSWSRTRGEKKGEGKGLAQVSGKAGSGLFRPFYFFCE